MAQERSGESADHGCSFGCRRSAVRRWSSPGEEGESRRLITWPVPQLPTTPQQRTHKCMRANVTALLMTLACFCACEFNTTPLTTANEEHERVQPSERRSRIYLGEPTRVDISSQPSPSGSLLRLMASTQELKEDGAEALKIHFDFITLHGDNSLEIRDENNQVVAIFSDTTRTDFWLPHIKGDRVVFLMYLYSQEYADEDGFRVDEYYSLPFSEQNGEVPPITTLSICGVDGLENIRCYSESSWQYQHSKPVARYTYVDDSGGTYACTGFLLTDGRGKNRFLTNNHCANSQSEVNSLTANFTYQHTCCSCSSTESGTYHDGDDFLVADGGGDFSLLTLSGNPADTQGQLTIDSSAPDCGDELYTIGHPGVTYDGRKRIDLSAECEVASCWLSFEHTCDTEQGSSGSPLIDYWSDNVVAIHHSASLWCPIDANGGTSMADIYPVISSYMACDCSSGTCCDGCSYRSSSTVCQSNADWDYGCPWGTSCGADVGIQYRDRYCSGSSSSCSGSLGSWKGWSTADYCSATEICADNDSSCNYSSTCCECTSGTCCDGCNYRSSSTVCQVNADSDYGCPWGTSCGADVGIQYRDRYCSGSSSSCSGSLGSWKGWSTADSCSTTETCTDNDSTCNYSAPCDCECTSGDCCDGCHYEPAGTSCTSDGNPCTDDVCNASGSCNHPNNSAPCDDGSFCNGADTCNAGSCTAHGGDPCPGPDGDGDCTESCNEGATDCTAADPTGSACDDGLFCGVADTCDAAGVCTPGSSSCSGSDFCDEVDNQCLSDTDTDGIPDVDDNCTTVANASQNDPDMEGYGAACDFDISNDNTVTDIFDVIAHTSKFGMSVPPADPNLDHTEPPEGVIDIFDVIGATSSFGGGPPGPSGLSCAGTAPCVGPNRCAHDICEEGPALDATCDYPHPTCVADICAAHASCCSTAWDALCVEEATTICGLSCEQGATLISGYSVTGGGAIWSGGDHTITVGLEFTPNIGILVDALGVFDEGDLGLGEQHSVGLWNRAGTLLAQVTIPSGAVATLDNGFRYESITPILLNAGTSYRIGASFNPWVDPSGDRWWGESWRGDLTLTPAIEIGLTSGAYYNTSTFAYPNSHITEDRAAASFRFRPVP